MPRKVRAEQPTLAERHEKWLGDYAASEHLPDTDAPFGAWRIDEIVANSIGAPEQPGAAVSSAIRLARFQSRSLAKRALGRATRDYMARHDRPLHEARVEEALALKARLEAFARGDILGEHVALWGLRAIDPEAPDRLADLDDDMETTALRLALLLGEYAESRKPLLNVGGDRIDHVAARFVELVNAVSPEVFGEHALSDAAKHRFALALWRDMKFPMPNGRAQSGNDLDWMRSRFRIVATEIKGATFPPKFVPVL